MDARAKDAKQAVTDASLKELRRGWCLGEKSFAEKILEELSGVTRPKRNRGSLSGEAACAHDAAEAERLAMFSEKDGAGVLCHRVEQGPGRFDIKGE